MSGLQRCFHCFGGAFMRVRVDTCESNDRRTRRRALRGGQRITVDEQTVPPFEAHQRPEKEAMVPAAADMLFQDSLHGRGPKISSVAGARPEDQLADIRE